jgi:hypothetical protein
VAVGTDCYPGLGAACSKHAHIWQAASAAAAAVARLLPELNQDIAAEAVQQKQMHSNMAGQC